MLNHKLDPIWKNTQFKPIIYNTYVTLKNLLTVKVLTLQ